MTTATAPAITRHAAQLAAACRIYPPTAWTCPHQVDVLCAAVADAHTGIPHPERICRDDADRAIYARHYAAAEPLYNEVEKEQQCSI